MGSCQSRVGVLLELWAQFVAGGSARVGAQGSAMARKGPRVRETGQETERWAVTDLSKILDGERQTEPAHQSGLGNPTGDKSVSAGVTHSLGVGTVGAEGQGEGWCQNAQLAHHLLHAP